jgi:recombination protein RecA
MSRMDDVKALMAEINKKHGDHLIVLASEVSDAVPRIPTGSMGLDVILGGGWPANQWVEIIGDESSGKTAVALKTVAANQKRDPDFSTLWVASEKWVGHYADMCGVDMGRVAVVETNEMEKAYDIAIEFADSRAVDAIVIDSLPALVPNAEDEKDMEGNVVGKGALLTGKFFRKVGKATKRSLVEEERPVLGIVINQWRQKIGQAYGDNRTTPGGLGKNYAFFVRLEVRRSEWIEDKHKLRIGQTIAMRTIKNKTGAPQRTAYVDFYFVDHGMMTPGDFDVAKEIMAMGVTSGAIKQSGAYFYFGEDKWQGKDRLATAIRENTSLYDQIAAEIDYILNHAPR